MPAYYIVSGDLDTKIMADNEIEACVKAIKRAYHNETISGLSFIMSVDQQGYSLKQETVIIPTAPILQKCGLLDQFDLTEHDFLFGQDEDFWNEP